MGPPVKTQVGNGLSKLFNFWVHTIDVSDQSVFTLTYLALHDEEGNKINVSGPITESQRKSDRFLLSTMTVHPYWADPK